MARITGRVEILLNGVSLLTKEGAIASNIGRSTGGPVEREAVMGDTGYHGSVDKPVAAECEFTLTDRDDVSLETLEAINGDGTLIFRSYGGGKEYTMNEAVCATPPKVTAGQGETEMKFFGPRWIESTG